VGKASGNGKCSKGLKMTNFKSKHVALLKYKIDCANIYCVTLIEFLALLTLLLHLYSYRDTVQNPSLPL